MRRAPSVLLLGAAALAAMATSCSGDSGGGDRVTLEVFAASSLTDAMWEIGEAYRETHPNTTLRFNFAGSASLVAQVNEGAPADVLVPADLQSAERLDAGIVGTSEVLTTNTLTIIVERGNPQSIDSLDDLARPGLAVVLAAPDVPIGKYAQEALDKAGVVVSPSSLEASAKAVVTKVVLGEADAGIVYTTDVIAAGDTAVGVVIPEQQNVQATYAVVVPREAEHPDEAATFIAFLRGPQAQAILNKFGFGR